MQIKKGRKFFCKEKGEKKNAIVSTKKNDSLKWYINNIAKNNGREQKRKKNIFLD